MFYFFYAQHVSDINTSIIRSLRLAVVATLVVCSCFDMCWGFGVVVWGGIRVAGFSLLHGYHPNPAMRMGEIIAWNVLSWLKLLIKLLLLHLVDCLYYCTITEVTWLWRKVLKVMYSCDLHEELSIEKRISMICPNQNWKLIQIVCLGDMFIPEIEIFSKRSHFIHHRFV